MFRKAKFSTLALIMTVGFLFGMLHSGEASGSVIFEVDADTPVALTGKTQSVTVRALVRPDGAAKIKRVPLAVALVLDKSGSMSSDGKMENAKLGTMEALKRLDAGDVAALVVYDDEALVKIPAKSASAQILRTRAETLARMAPSPMQSEIESDARDMEALSATLTEEKNMSSEQRKRVLNQAYIQKNQQAPASEKR